MSEKIVQLNEEVIKGQIKKLVQGSVEETLNGLLEDEAEKQMLLDEYGLKLIDVGGQCSLAAAENAESAMLNL